MSRSEAHSLDLEVTWTSAAISGDDARPDPRARLPRTARTSRRKLNVALALMWFLPAACTTIGPSVAIAPGPGKSAETFAGDRAGCTAETDARIQPMANGLNMVPRGPSGIAADNQAIQRAYDSNYGQCMAARGNGPAAMIIAPSPNYNQPEPFIVNVQGRRGGIADQGPAADAFRRWFVTRAGCFDRQAREARCSLAVNLEQFKLYYGDAGHGVDGDVLVLAMIQDDPTGNGDAPLVGYLRREGAAYRFVKELADVRAAGVAPGTTVRFSPGRISFVGLTHREAEGRNFRTGKTPIIVRTD